jgi:hypothetical protein
MTHIKLLASFAALVTLVLLLPCPAASQENPPKDDGGASVEKLAEMLKEGEPAFTQEQADSAVKEIVPLVEEVAGRKFKDVPAVKLVDRTAGESALERDLTPQFANISPGMDEASVAKNVRSIARVMAPTMLGKYSFEDRVLLLLPGNYEPLFKVTKTDTKHLQPVLKLIVAHELTHALQFQQVDVAAKLNIVKNSEELSTLHATIEGHAMFVQDEIGKRLGLDASVMEFSRMMSAGCVKIDDPVLDMSNKFWAKLYEQRYMCGKMFIEFHFKKSGNEGLWNILREPPVTTAMIAYPETYSPKREGAAIDYAKVFDGLEKDFGEKKWTVRNSEVGHMVMQASYTAMPDKDREEILANIEHVQNFMAFGDDNTGGSVAVFVMKDGQLVPKMITALEGLTRNMVEMFKEKAKDGTIEISDLAIEDFTVIRADVARKLSFSGTRPGGKAMRQEQYFVLRGNILIQLDNSNIELSDEKVSAILEKVFKRYADQTGAGK